MEARFRPPTLVEHEGFDVVGLAARTNRHQEADPRTAEISRLWQRFFDENVSRRVTDAIPGRVATVYQDYASRADGYYTVVLGLVAKAGQSAPAGLIRTQVPAGRYLEFMVDGMPPEAMLAAWSRIRDWFADEQAYARAFHVDFELLRPGSSTICISITGAHNGT
ncbi:MAG: GyrI-like domain-containing protein [Gemmatimonadetes bacterium]|nr:GyrI-like domain-containing protein [Gemmatimonadota bacterium]